MDYNEREAQRRQEDRDLNRALIWVGAAVVLEFLLSLINKYYINFRTTPESINLALAISAALNGLRWVSLAALAACVVWVVLRLKQGGRAGLQLSLAAVSAALYLCAQITLVFQESGIRMLFWLVPAWAALALVYYLYQREFFLSALVSGVGVLGLWFVRHAGASSFYTIGAVAVILVLAVMMLWLKGHGGRLFSGEAGQLLPEEAGIPPDAAQLCDQPGGHRHCGLCGRGAVLLPAVRHGGLAVCPAGVLYRENDVIQSIRNEKLEIRNCCVLAVLDFQERVQKRRGVFRAAFFMRVGVDMCWFGGAKNVSAPR